jgi:hypothetical protein
MSALPAEMFCFGVDRLELATSRTTVVTILFCFPTGSTNCSVVQGRDAYLTTDSACDLRLFFPIALRLLYHFLARQTKLSLLIENDSGS